MPNLWMGGVGTLCAIAHYEPPCFNMGQNVPLGIRCLRLHICLNGGLKKRLVPVVHKEAMSNDF